MPKNTKPIAESGHFIVLDEYVTKVDTSGGYQSEEDLEREFIRDLENQGYEFLSRLTTPDAMLSNIRVRLQGLNNVTFTDGEWSRFVETYLDNPSDNCTDKAKKIHDDYIHDFTFDDGRVQNIYLLDKKNLARNKVEVIDQFEQSGSFANRYDVTILVNGLPLVQVELKRRGVRIREAFNQVHRYSKESFNSDNSLYKFLQIFVISNGTDTRYFPNTAERKDKSFDFTIQWAKSDNSPIKDLKDFTATFFQKDVMLSVLLRYSVLSKSKKEGEPDVLLTMRPYQIAATERILWKIKSLEGLNSWADSQCGGYIWHTTGSGKTLTSFKAAQLATELDFVDRVLFVVDRKDLDYQTMKEYQKFSQDSVNGSSSTAELKINLNPSLSKNDDKITVTTIQKLNCLMKSERDLPVYKKKVVFIFDECHRSQFGETQGNLKKKFKQFCQFGFTGTPIFRENALKGDVTTEHVFGHRLHSYVITDAIRDDKVLKFKVDYNNVRPKFKDIESEKDLTKLTAAENKQMLMHPSRIEEISRYVLDNFDYKTHRLQGGGRGFNAMFAVSSVEAAKMYYTTLKKLQQNRDRRLRIATIFSFAANEDPGAVGDIPDEGFEDSISSMDKTSKEFLCDAIEDYNKFFKTSYSIESKGFQEYYKNLSNRVKNREVDLLIVVGMFLTGFDAPRLNTLFVDKNLRYHGLIQAYSRTNRIHDSNKSFGNIVTFRDLEEATIDAIRLFGDESAARIVLEKGYEEYMHGGQDAITGKEVRGFSEIVRDLKQNYPDHNQIITGEDKVAFAKVFGEFLRSKNILQNYDEFTALKALQEIVENDAEAVESFKERYHISDDDFEAMREVEMLSDREVQDYLSTYNDIQDWVCREKNAQVREKLTVNLDDIEFETELLKSQEINLDYILWHVFESKKKDAGREDLIEEARRMIRSSIGSRAKEGLVTSFLEQVNLSENFERSSLIDAFYQFARKELEREMEELIESESLASEAAKRYIGTSLKRGCANDYGTSLKDVMPKMSPLSDEYLSKKNTIFKKIEAFVEKFKGIGLKCK